MVTQRLDDGFSAIELTVGATGPAAGLFHCAGDPAHIGVKLAQLVIHRVGITSQFSKRGSGLRRALIEVIHSLAGLLSCRIQFIQSINGLLPALQQRLNVSADFINDATGVLLTSHVILQIVLTMVFR